MSDDEKTVEERLSTLEKSAKSSFPSWIRDLVTILSPLALAVLGYYFNATLQEARNQIDENELHIRRVQTAQTIMTALFEGDYEEARVFHVLFKSLLEDSDLHASIDAGIQEYFAAKYQKLAGSRERLGQEDLELLADTAAGAARFFPDQPAVIAAEDRLHVIILSLSRGEPGKFARIRTIAEQITADPGSPRAEIWCSSTGDGFYSLTLGRHPAAVASSIGRAAVTSDLAEEFYVTQGEHIYRQVWPGQDPGDQDPCL